MKNLSFLCCAMVFGIAVLVKAQNISSTADPKVIVDNDKMTVTEYNSEPGKDVCGAGKHSHPAHLTVLLTDAVVRITGADGKAMDQKVPSGTTFWSDAETHEIVNNGDKPIKAYIIQTKK